MAAEPKTVDVVVCGVTLNGVNAVVDASKTDDGTLAAAEPKTEAVVVVAAADVEPNTEAVVVLGDIEPNTEEDVVDVGVI